MDGTIGQDSTSTPAHMPPRKHGSPVAPRKEASARATSPSHRSTSARATPPRSNRAASPSHRTAAKRNPAAATPSPAAAAVATAPAVESVDADNQQNGDDGLDEEHALLIALQQKVVDRARDGVLPHLILGLTLTGLKEVFAAAGLADETNGYAARDVVRKLASADGLSVCERLQAAGSQHVGVATAVVTWHLGSPLSTLLEGLANLLESTPCPRGTFFWIRDFSIHHAPTSPTATLAPAPGVVSASSASGEGGGGDKGGGDESGGDKGGSDEGSSDKGGGGEGEGGEGEGDEDGSGEGGSGEGGFGEWVDLECLEHVIKTIGHTLLLIERLHCVCQSPPLRCAYCVSEVGMDAMSIRRPPSPPHPLTPSALSPEPQPSALARSVHSSCTRRSMAWHST